jgi:hypothetical protein
MYISGATAETPSNFRIFEEAADNDEQKYVKSEISFDVAVDDKGQSQDDRVETTIG